MYLFIDCKASGGIENFSEDIRGSLQALIDCAFKYSGSFISIAIAFCCCFFIDDQTVVSNLSIKMHALEAALTRASDREHFGGAHDFISENILRAYAYTFCASDYRNISGLGQNPLRKSLLEIFLSLTRAPTLISASGKLVELFGFALSAYKPFSRYNTLI